jgi:hypothetical protein
VTVPGPADDPRLLPALGELREIYYRQDLGTWYSVRLCVPCDDAPSFGANLSWEALWRTPTQVPVEAYREDLRRFPVAEAAMPPWLSAKVAEPPQPRIGLPAQD